MFVSGKDIQTLNINLTQTCCFFPLWLDPSALLGTHVEIRPRVNLHLPCAYQLTCVYPYIMYYYLSCPGSRSARLPVPGMTNTAITMLTELTVHWHIHTWL